MRETKTTTVPALTRAEILEWARGPWAAACASFPWEGKRWFKDLTPQLSGFVATMEFMKTCTAAVLPEWEVPHQLVGDQAAGPSIPGGLNVGVDTLAGGIEGQVPGGVGLRAAGEGGEEALLSKGVGLPLPLDAEGEVDEIAAGGDGGRSHGGNRGILTESATMDAWEVTSLIPAPRGRLGTVPYTTIIAAPSFPHVLKWIAEWLPANGKDTQTIRKLGRVGAVLIETSTGVAE